MNKRIKIKKEKSKNKKRMESILSEIRKEFTITNKIEGDGYFIFEFGKNSVCHFYLKETPMWKYGIWLGDGDNFKIFGEHIWLLDKFKPSRTHISCDNVFEFMEKVKDVRDNPKYHFVNSLTRNSMVFQFVKIYRSDFSYYEGWQVENGYVEKVVKNNLTQDEAINRRYDKYINNKNEMDALKDRERKMSFDFFKSLLSIDEVEQALVRDKNTAGWHCSPRYGLLVVVKKGLPDDVIDDLFTNIEKLEYDNLYKSGRKTYEYTFSFEGIINEEEVKKFKNYQYKYFNNTNI